MAVLFFEGLLFLPVVIAVGILSDVTRTLEYLIPWVVATLPYVVMKKAPHRANAGNIAGTLLALIASVGYLVFFSGLVLASCAGHPPW